MNRANLLACVGLATGVAASAGWAFSAGDPAAGRDFATQRCAGCHDIPGYYRGAGIGPSFADFAAAADSYDMATLKAAMADAALAGRRPCRESDATNVVSFVDLLRAEGEGDGE